MKKKKKSLGEDGFMPSFCRWSCLHW